MHKKDGQSNTSHKALPPRNFRFASGDVFIIGAIVLFCVILIGGMWFYRKSLSDSSKYVRITRNGEVLLQKSLSEFSEPSEFLITTDNGRMVILISSDKVCVKESDCPDKICVHQGDLTEIGDGAVCLPNRVVVEIISGKEDNSGEVDVVSR